MSLDMSYNLYPEFAQIPYKVMEYLMTANENIWKLLYYDTQNALSSTNANLTLAQKRALIYGGQADSSPYRLFTIPFTYDAIEQEQTQLRIYIRRVDPKNAQIGSVDICFDAFCHNKIAVLSYPNYKPNRWDIMFEELMKTLNGKDIDTLGRIYFNRAGLSGSSGCNLLSFSQDNVYQGYRIIMSTNVG